MTKTSTCLVCGTPISHPATGRHRTYCSTKCRSASYRTRSGTTATSQRLYDDAVRRIGKSTLARAQAVDRSARQPVPALPLELLENYVALQRDTADGIAVAIRQAKDNGVTWPEIAKTMQVSESTLKRNFSEEKVNKALQRRQQRRPAQTRTVLTPHASRRVIVGKANRSRPGEPGSRLAHALSHLRRSRWGERPMSTLASHMEVSTSYVYRIMVGDRTPSWEVTEAFARACDADPGDLIYLWNLANGLPPAVDDDCQTYEDAVHALQGALRGLHLAGLQPDLHLLLRRPDVQLLMDDVTELLGPGSPPTPCLRWPVVRDLTRALYGDVDDLRVLWERVDELSRTPRDPGDDGPRLPAGSFG
ncbi:helix-turn-helix domain-containing protein [Streptomyces ramulosus]|uniref:Helix-turn-helix domain-containing protein n=1 Tax=Streptomyces ramulosus TaxID=47762 RepID=A0ABW1FBB1_9ACTN